MKKVEINMNSVASVVFLSMWLVGIVVAKGFWSTLFSIFFVPWAWYLAAEHIMVLNGWL
jgi:hypothetical protein